MQVGFVLRDESLTSTIDDDRRAVITDAVVAQARGAGLDSAEAEWDDDVLVLTVPDATDPDGVVDAINTNRLSFRPVCADLPIADDPPNEPLTASDEPGVENVGCEGLEPAIEEAETAADTPLDEVAGSAVAIISVPSEDDEPGQRTMIGRPLLTQDAVESARTSPNQFGDWPVNLTFRDGADGIDLFNQAAEMCFDLAPSCPTGRLAIVWNGEIVSAPAINAPSFTRDAIVLSGPFDEQTARDVVTELSRAQLLGLVEVSWTSVNP